MSRDSSFFVKIAIAHSILVIYCAGFLRHLYMRRCNGVHEKSQNHLVMKNITVVMNKVILFVIKASVMQ